MAFENLNVEDEMGPEPEEEIPPEETSNRTFLIVAGVLGAIAILALICIALFALVWLPSSKRAQEQQIATLDAQNTEVALIIDRTSTAAAQAAIEAAWTATPTQTPLASPTPSPTFVVAMPSPTAESVTQVVPAEMATTTALHATLTANAIFYQATQTVKPAQPTAIPDTGFADDVGLPLMLGLAVLLIVIIFLARRLRSA
jgi:hypothetical protein